MLRTRLASGDLVRVRPGVFVAAGQWSESAVDRHLVWARAEQAAHPRAVISHGSAALGHGLPHPAGSPWEDGPVTLLVDGGSRPSRPGVVYRHGPLPREQVVRDPTGARVTSIPRTAVDLADGIGLPEALVLLDAAARLTCGQLVSRPRRTDYRNPRLVAAARELLTNAATTIRSVRVVRAIELVEPCRESPIESLAAGHFHLAGLPRPLFQEPVRTPVGVLFPDCLWPEHRLIGEADGAVKYTGPEPYLEEKEREQVFRDLGFGVVRWLGKEITWRPGVVVDRVARALGVS
ncbi:MAG: hypothetical protein QM779_10155 [Propionicimonas sp.]|uniref:hypothetical protein n=1 Tax=Propionicimonas sp. TaxID=1955623 RepID=UPI003D13F86D